MEDVATLCFCYAGNWQKNCTVIARCFAQERARCSEQQDDRTWGFPISVYDAFVSYFTEKIQEVRFSSLFLHFFLLLFAPPQSCGIGKLCDVGACWALSSGLSNNVQTTKIMCYQCYASLLLVLRIHQTWKSALVLVALFLDCDKLQNQRDFYHVFSRSSRSYHHLFWGFENNITL